MTRLIEQFLLIALVPFSFSLLLDVCLGSPGAEEKFDIKAIFFPFSFWLAKRRLKALGKFEELMEGFKKNLVSQDLAIREETKKSFTKLAFDQGRGFFSWEKGVGMCPVCTNIRISIIFAFLCALLLNVSFYGIVVIPCFSNMFLLFFNKLKS